MDARRSANGLEDRSWISNNTASPSCAGSRKERGCTRKAASAGCFLELAQLLRILIDGDRMEIDHADEVLLFPLAVDPAPDGTEVVAEVEVARGLDAGEDASHVRGIGRR